MSSHKFADLARKHPELTDELEKIHGYLFDIKGRYFQIEPTADYLKLPVSQLNSILYFLEQKEIIKKEDVFLCPQDGEILEINDDGEYICPLCGPVYDLAECEEEKVYRTIERINRPAKYTFPNGYALLIGVANYRKLIPLNHALDDIQKIRNQLINKNGYFPEHIRSVSDGTINDIHDGLDWISRNTEEQRTRKTALIYFSGHGFQAYGLSAGEYFCTYETDLTKIEDTAISTRRFAKALETIPAENVIVFLDACHSGGFIKSSDLNSIDPRLKITYGLSSEGYEQLGQSRKVVIFASCSPNEKSMESKEYQGGLFTHYLLEALGGAADNSRELWTQSVIAYVSKNVSSENEKQNPIAYGVSTSFRFGWVAET